MYAVHVSGSIIVGNQYVDLYTFQGLIMRIIKISDGHGPLSDEGMFLL